jgi:O-antigen ligase
VKGLIWSVAVWGLTFGLAYRWRDRNVVLRDWFSRETAALTIALLGTFSIAASSSAEEVLREPLAVERIIRGGIAALALAIVMPLFIHRVRSYRAGYRALAGLFAYVGFAAVSTVYSAAPLVTAAKVGELLAAILPIVTIAIGQDAARRLRSTVVMLLTLMTALLAVAVVGFVVLPSVFSNVQTRPGFIMRETLVSPYLHNNSLSAYGAIIATFCIAAVLQIKTNRRMWLTGSVVGTAALVLAAGRQGVAMLVAGLAVVLWAQRRSLFLTLLGPGVIAIAYAYRDLLFTSLARNRPSTFLTLSGRLYWWEAAIDAWSAHPWTGWGYAAGGRFVALASIGSGRISNIHSGYLESLVGVGILGIAGLIYSIGCVVIWSVKSLRTETWLAVLIVPLALRTGVSQGFGGWLNVEFAFFVLLAAIADRARISQRDGQPHARAEPLPIG